MIEDFQIERLIVFFNKNDLIAVAALDDMMGYVR